MYDLDPRPHCGAMLETSSAGPIACLLVDWKASRRRAAARNSCSWDRVCRPSTGERFWGESVLVPLGQRLDPELPSDAIREALGIAADELLLLTGAAAEVISTAALWPLTRAQIRLALEELAS